MAVTTLRKAERDNKGELILAEASAQFNEHGFHDVRLEDIAEALDATKASISYHFDSKRALLEAAYMRTCDLLDGFIDSARKETGGIAQASAWIRQVGQMQSEALLNARAQPAILNDLNALDEPARNRVAARIGAQFEAIESFLCVASQRRGSRGATLLLWTLPAWIGPWLAAIPARRHERQVEALARLLRDGIAKRSEPMDPPPLQLSGGTTDLLFNREERNRLKRDAFERAGIRSFNRRGYAGFSLNALADDLGVSRGTFYYTFADKDELLESCARRSHARILAILDSIDATPGPVLHRIEAGLAKLYSEHVSNLEPMLRSCIYTSLPSAREAIAEAEWQGIAARMARLLAESSEEGGRRETQVEKLELLILAALRNIAVSPGLVGAVGGNPFSTVSATDYFAPFFRGISK